MRAAVIGSRTFRNFHLMEEELLDFVGPDGPAAYEVIISGGAKGADSLAEKFAKKYNIPTKIFLPNFKMYRHPYHHRNRLIAEDCDVLIAFWDTYSTGTKYTINYARRIGKDIKIVKF